MLRPVFLMLLASIASESQKAFVEGLFQQTTAKQNSEVPCVSTPLGAFGTSRVPALPRISPLQLPGAAPRWHPEKEGSRL
mmetsp:Transcript_25307/g.76085  ORF Transcript_25307/g.76085 Transcript_25307/m.76085 type:complete len:80 (-) Transcript_25307:3239-3478(-)